MLSGRAWGRAERAAEEIERGVDERPEDHEFCQLAGARMQYEEDHQRHAEHRIRLVHQILKRRKPVAALTRADAETTLDEAVGQLGDHVRETHQCSQPRPSDGGYLRDRRDRAEDQPYGGCGGRHHDEHTTPRLVRPKDPPAPDGRMRIKRDGQPRKEVEPDNRGLHHSGAHQCADDDENPARVHARSVASAALPDRPGVTRAALRLGKLMPMPEESTHSRASLRCLAPNSLTVARPVVGVMCGVAVYQHRGIIAAWLYLAGFMTDVGDGLLARALGVESASGRRLDGWADVAFHGFVGAGLAAYAVRDRNALIVVILGVLLAGSVITRRWFDVYSVLGKAMAIPYRVVMFALIATTGVSRYRPETLALGAGILAVAFTYEGVVTWREFKQGSRMLRRPQ